MASSKWQRRHYETIAAGLREKGAPDSEVQEWIRKFQADNPRFRADYFLAAVRGGPVTVLGPRTRSGGRREITKPHYTPRSTRVKPFRVPKLHGYSGCVYGKKRSRGRWVCRKSRRRR